MNKRIHLHIALVFMLVSGINLNAQKYFVSFADKNNNAYSIHSPSDFLSQRSIDRRARQNIAITSQDLPVSQTYVDSVKSMGLKIYWASKWLNGLIVESSNQQLMDTISRISFISDVTLIWKQSLGSTASKFNKPQGSPSQLKNSAIYGAAWNQTQTVNGQYLHQNNYEGQNMVVAVLDNGFKNVNSLSSFAHLRNAGRILSQRDIVNPGNDVYETDEHGANVLSIMGGFLNGEFKGSAPMAAYHLIRTEDNASEYPIEEYNWVIGAEYADSIGADIINSSLGYSTFDGDFKNYTYQDMDGKTTVVTRGAQIAFSKGMLVVCSAGNEGAKTWNKITAPADGYDVLTIAAMASDSTRASFSSYGPTYDQRIKPDIAAMGKSTALQNTLGSIVFGDGTSFSSPVIAGFVACLWQANPQLKNTELLQLVRQSGHIYSQPNYSFGYGIPDFKKALGRVNNIVSDKYDKLKIYPNPFDNYLAITSSQNVSISSISIYDLTGNKVYQEQGNQSLPLQIKGLDILPKGIFLLKVEQSGNTQTFKIIKK